MSTGLTIFPGFIATPHRFLWHAATRTAILSDVHVGLEESLAHQGIYMPEVYATALRSRWQRMLEYQPSHLVIAGDLFDSPAPSERAADFCRNLLAQTPCPITITPGNHDPASIAELFPRMPVATGFSVAVGKGLISHGHETIATGEPLEAPHAYDVWIVGHQHPALTLATKVQQAKMPCYALCLTKIDPLPPNILILPAFSPGPLGSNLLAKGNWLLPFARPGNEQIQIFGLIESSTRAPQVLSFGPLSMHE